MYTENMLSFRCVNLLYTIGL